MKTKQNKKILKAVKKERTIPVMADFLSETMGPERGGTTFFK